MDDGRLSRRTGSTTPWWYHLLAVLWVVVLALLVLGPALRRGPMIGTYDLLSDTSLTSRAGVHFYGNTFNTDPINQMIPWTSLAWTQVHHGVLPLWNPYNGLGLPLAFNWQSAVFSIPTLVGYLTPLRYAYTASVVVTLVIAGSGGYVLGRVLRLGMVGALTVASVFELSGPLIAWLGYPQAQAMAWGGWLFASAILIVRSRRRVPSIVLFAVVLACTIYAGHPETLIVMVVATLLLVILVLISRALPARFALPRGPVLRPVLDLFVAGIAGAALGAPLLLPGLQLTGGSIRSASSSANLLPLHDTFFLLFSSFDGEPLSGNYAFGGSYFYDETAAYIGVIALVLASMGLMIGVVGRRPEVLGLAVVGAAMAAIVYVGPAAHLVSHLPLLNEVDWLRALMPLSLVLAALAGVGVDAITKSARRPIVRFWPIAGFAAAALCLGVLWLVGRGGGLPSFGHSVAVHVRAESFVGPVVGVALGLIVSAIVLWRSRWRAAGAAVLLIGEVALLVSAGSTFISSSSDGYPPTKAVAILQRTVGDARVGTGPNGCSLGISPDANIFFGVREFDLYDPIVPKAYYSEWQHQARTSAGSAVFDLFCPDITTVSEARQFGLSYLLEPKGTPGPVGSVMVATLPVPNPDPGNPFRQPPGNEVLYSVPHSGVATLTTGYRLALAATATVKDSGSNPAQINVVTHSHQNGVLRIRVTDVPGWHASINGRPLALESSSVFALQARIPAGTHHIVLSYWPPLFSVGLVLALVAALALIAALVWDRRRRQRRVHRTNGAGPPRSPPGRPGIYSWLRDLF